MVIALTIGTTVFAQDKAYKDGTVWTVGFIKTEANMGDEYLKSLKTTWVAVHEEAVKQGLIVSYKVLSGVSANPDDWDIMLMTEYKSLTAMEGQDDKWDAIFKKVVGDDAASKKLNDSRTNMRTIFGNKMLRELSFK